MNYCCFCRNLDTLFSCWEAIQSSLPKAHIKTLSEIIENEQLVDIFNKINLALHIYRGKQPSPRVYYEVFDCVHFHLKNVKLAELHNDREEFQKDCDDGWFSTGAAREIESFFSGAFISLEDDIYHLEQVIGEFQMSQ